MVFSSLLFLFYFLPIVLGVYYMSPRPVKNLTLFISSLFFYAWGEPVYVFLMLFSTIADYCFGRSIAYFKGQHKLSAAKILLVCSILSNIGLLAFFKYADFLVNNINSLFGTQIEALNLPLPIGISFYIFQSLSYIIDVYKGEIKAQKSIVAYGTYISLFPQLIAGPIVRYQTVEEQMLNRVHTSDMFVQGIRRFTIGLGKKVLLANNIGMLWDTISTQNVTTMPVLTAWLGIIAFTFQIYFDFSGYSDMAIGLGKMFGFTFLENFNYPYMSKSITEFWRRWHMSLSTWFKEYVYIPLGGNRHGLIKQIRNILIVWALTGIWHGASWNFVLWGVYFGILLICEKMFMLKVLEKAPNALRHLYTMLLVIISWVIFSFDSASVGISYIKAMFGVYGAGLFTPESIYYLYTNAVLLVALALGCTTLPKRKVSTLMERLQTKEKTSTVVEVSFILFIFIIATAYLVNSSYNPFLYFRF